MQSIRIFGVGIRTSYSWEWEHSSSMETGALSIRPQTHRTQIYF